MTVLLIFLIVLSAVAASMLSVKLILELWRLCSHLSKHMEYLRKNFWRILFTTIVRIVLIVYGTWALYCLYQFRAGDSWAAALLAGITLGLFTGVLAFFTIRIFSLATKARKLDGGVEELYEHKPWMRKYGFFYDQFKSKMWWFFLPILVYVLIRAIVIVFGAESGMAQTIGVLATEAIFLTLLFWRRPYDGRGANVVNAMISVVRLLSIGCILIFVEQLGMFSKCYVVNDRNDRNDKNYRRCRSPCHSVNIDNYSCDSHCCCCGWVVSPQTQAKSQSESQFK